VSRIERSLPLYLIFCFFVMVSCSPEVETGPQIPTAQVADDTPLPAASTLVPATLPAPVIVKSTVEPTPKATATLSPHSTDETVPEESAIRYRVAFVKENDTLNLRDGPGIQNEIISELSPRADDILVVGSGESANGSEWWPIRIGNESGWVNSRFLTQDISAEEFCKASQTESIITDFIEAISTKDSDLLDQIIDPERGLRIRRHWWNPEVMISGEQLVQLFESEERYDWGVADGSGDPIDGTFAEVILPLLERDMIPAQEIGCNEILSGGTAGIVQLPFPYESVNFYSLYRPASPDEIEFNWGAWVVGIEKVLDSYFVSYLVHFEWEI